MIWFNHIKSAKYDKSNTNFKNSHKINSCERLKFVFKFLECER